MPTRRPKVLVNDSGSTRPVVWVLLGFAVAVAVLLLSPLLLILTNVIFPLGDSWQLLSSIGQSFGGVAAIFSAIALIGVAYSVQTQSKQVLAQRIEAVGTQQRELIFKILDDPTLGTVINHASGSEEDRRLAVRGSYRNLWFMYLFNAYRLGELSDESIRRGMQEEFFSSEEGVRFWHYARAGYLVDSNTADELRFVKVVDEEYEAAKKRFEINQTD